MLPMGKALQDSDLEGPEGAQGLTSLQRMNNHPKIKEQKVYFNCRQDLSLVDVSGAPVDVAKLAENLPGVLPLSVFQ